MEQDIKILEEKVELYYDCAVIDEDGFDMRVDIAFMKKDAQALENLIKGYRELKEKNNKNEQLIKVFQSEKSKCIVEHVPKSKIKEIRDKAEVMDYYVLGDVIDDLNKLLEDK